MGKIKGKESTVLYTTIAAHFELGAVGVEGLVERGPGEAGSQHSLNHTHAGHTQGRPWSR